jgi:uncharacterized membrane protein
MIRAIGRLEATVSSNHASALREIAHIRREVMGHVMLLHRKSNGGHKGIPWMQIAAMAGTAIASLIGLLKPELAAALLRAIAH